MRNDIVFDAFRESFASQGTFNEIMDWIVFFEDEYDCAGICKPSVFYWNKGLGSGVPGKACVSSIQDEVGSAFMGLGISSFVAGILFFFIFIFQYCLWKKY